MEVLIRKEQSSHMTVNYLEDIEYLTFPLLEQTNLIKHMFTTRRGGVSKGIFSSMNLSFNRGDDLQAVKKNFERAAMIFDEPVSQIVCSAQTHTTNIRLVTKEDCGKGVTRRTDFKDVDGLITNIPNIILCTSFADCVPLYFVDIKNKAIGLAHSGWRGTAAKMGLKMLQEMYRSFGTNPFDVMAAIGPCICNECYEVSEDVYNVFQEAFPNHIDTIIKKGKTKNKYQLDLSLANQLILTDNGVKPQNIAVSDLCTCCNSHYLFSHRATEGKRGNMAAFLELRKS